MPSMIRPATALLVVTALALLPMRADAKGESAAKLLRAIPAGATAVLQVTDAAHLVEMLQATPFYRLRSRPEFATLIGQLEQGWKQACREAREEAGIDLDALAKSARGDLSIVLGDTSALIRTLVKAATELTEPEFDFETLPLLLTFDAKDQKSAFESNAGKLIDKAREEGVRVESTEFRDGTITILHTPDAGSDGPKRIYLAQLGSRFFMAISQTYLRDVMARLSQGDASGSLAESSEFRQAWRRAGEDGDLVFYLDFASIIRALDLSLGTGQYAMIWLKVKQLLLGEKLSSVSGAIHIERTGVREKLLIRNGKDQGGIFGWFLAEPESFPARVPSIVPQDALTSSSFTFAPRKIFAAIRDVAAMMMVFDLDGMVKQQIGISLPDLEKGFGSRVHIFNQAGPTETNPMGDLTIVMELEDDAPFRDLLQKLQTLSGGQLRAEKVQGRDIYPLPIGLPGVEPALYAGDRMFVIGIDRKGVEQVMLRAGKDLPGVSEKPEFRELMAQLKAPSQVAAINWSDPKYLEVVIGNLAGALESDVVDLGGLSSTDVAAMLKAVGKVFGGSVGYSRWEDQGLYSEAWITWSD